MEKFLFEYIKNLRRKFTISTDDEKDFVEMRAALKGMLQDIIIIMDVTLRLKSI